VALPGAHDDNEIIVHFTQSKVVHLSSLVNGFNFPSVDGDGDALKFAELVGRAIELLPDDVLIVSGHNGTGTTADLHAYRDMLVETADVVREGLSDGKDLASLQEDGALSRWEAYAGSYVSVDEWTEYLVDALEGDDAPRRTVFEPLYATWTGRGAEAAVAQYLELKRDHVDEYAFHGTELLVVGIKLLENDHSSDAVTFLEASLQDQPDSDYAYYVEYQLADAYSRLGDREAALRHCDESLKLRPGFAPVEALRESLASR
jgi:tetratricopeptide (TPR) repeat protein